MTWAMMRLMNTIFILHAGTGNQNFGLEHPFQASVLPIRQAY